MQCILFHKWGKWEQYDQPYTYSPGIIAPKEIRGHVFTAVEVRQVRTCQACGKQQDKLVVDRSH